MSEEVAAWRPVADIESPCASITLCTGPDEYIAGLHFSQMRDNPPRDLVVRFRRVFARASHEEFVHPWNTGRSDASWPHLSGNWAGYSFPLLEIRGSEWLDTFSDSQILEPELATARHYRFVSLDNIVDVLTDAEASAKWAPVAV